MAGARPKLPAGEAVILTFRLCHVVPTCCEQTWPNDVYGTHWHTLTHIDIHTHIVYLYIYTQMYYICTIYNELYAYISYILAQSMLHDIHWTWWLPPCDANAMRCQRRSRVALTWKLSMDCCSRAEVLWTPKNVAVPQKRVSVSKMFLGFGKVR